MIHSNALLSFWSLRVCQGLSRWKSRRSSLRLPAVLSWNLETPDEVVHRWHCLHLPTVDPSKQLPKAGSEVTIKSGMKVAIAMDNLSWGACSCTDPRRVIHSSGPSQYPTGGTAQWPSESQVTLGSDVPHLSVTSTVCSKHRGGHQKLAARWSKLQDY